MNHLRIESDIIMPNGLRLAFSVEISDEMFRESFAPLPHEREIYFMFDTQEHASLMRRRRAHLARAVAERLGRQILESVESQDPQYGYSTQEWARITK